MVRSIGRIIWVAIALALAAIAGVVVLGLVGLERVTAAMHEAPEASSEFMQWMDMAGLLFGLSQWGMTLSVVPAILVVVVGELAHIRSLVYWVAAGGGAVVAAPVLNGLAASAPEMAVPGTALLPILATAGFAAGVVYWVLAGRSS
jgi:hypothetical protein